MSASVLAFTVKALGTKETAAAVSQLAGNIKGDLKGISDGATNLGTAAGKAFGSLEQTLASSTGSFGQLAASLGPVGLGFAAVAGAVTIAGGALASVINQFVEYGGHIKDLSQESGLAAETLSTLAAYSRLAGKDVGSVTSALEVYGRKISEAAHGNEAMSKTMQRFGIDAKAALQNPDKAARDLFDRLAKIDNEWERLDAAQALAGKSGKVLATVAAEMGGSFDAAARAAKEWGIVLSQEDVEAADKFGDAWEVLKMRSESVIYDIARGALPELQKAIDDVAGGLDNSHASWQEWGRQAGGAVRDIIKFVRDLDAELEVLRPVVDWLNENSSFSGVFRKRGGPPLDPLGPGARFGGMVNSPDQLPKSGPPHTTRPTGGIGDVLRPTAKERKDALDKLKEFVKEWDFVITSTTGGGHNKGSMHYAGRAADVSVRGKSAQEIEAMMAAARAAGYGVRDERTRPPGQAVWSGPHIHLETLTKAAQAANKELDTQDKILDSLARKIAQADLELQGFDRTTVEQEIAATRLSLGLDKLKGPLADRAREMLRDYEATLKAKEAREKQAEAVERVTAAVEEQIKELQGEQYELLQLDKLIADAKAVNAIDARTESFLRLGAAMRAAAVEIGPLNIEGIGGSGEDTPGPAVSPEDIAAMGPPPEMFSKWEQFGNTVRGILSQMSDQAGNYGTIVSSVFGSVGQAVGNAVRSFVLLGSAGGSVRKWAAEVIAGVAQMAAVKAVFELAEGLAALARAFFGDPKAGAEASMHFSAAAQYGAVAGIAALVGRGVAGNAFKQDASGGGASGGGGGFGSSSQDNGTRSVEQPRNTVIEHVHILRVESNDSHILNVITKDVRSNGPTRGLIIETAAA